MADAEPWTIGRLLTWTTKYLTERGADSPRLDAELLLAQAVGCPRIGLYTAFDTEPPEPVRTAFRELVRRRAEGTPVAYLLSQRHFRFYHVVDTIIDLPTVLPPSVAGVALLMAFGRRGLFGAWLTAMGISIPFTVIAVIMAQTFIAAPLYVKAATIGFGSIDSELRQAAALDGANRWQIFRYVDLPLSWMALLSGSVMTWARAMGEFGATIIFAGNYPGRTQTMPLAIYIGFEIDLNVALTLAVILICFSFLTLLIVKGVLHRRLAANLGSTVPDRF